MLEVGKKYRIDYGFEIKKIHVLVIVDEDQIVYKWYGKHKQWWHYGVESGYYFSLLEKDGRIKEVQ
jgi:hypothetical protein